MVANTITGSRPAKRVKACNNENTSSIYANSKNPFLRVSGSSSLQIEDNSLPGVESHSDEGLSVLDAQPTELESTFPQVDVSSKAVSEYESSFIPTDAVDIPVGFKERLKIRKWARGRGSIYVDAFNLALSTVLEEEGHLFVDFEKAIFDQWYQLDYEAQYL
jgi:Fanconi-associated nuclease 1